MCATVITADPFNGLALLAALPVPRSRAFRPVLPLCRSRALVRSGLFCLFASVVPGGDFAAAAGRQLVCSGFVGYSLRPVPALPSENSISCWKSFYFLSFPAAGGVGGMRLIF